MQLIGGTAHVADLDSFLGDLDDIATETDCTVQAFDARYVVDVTHLRRAVELADRAFERGENVARDRGVEIMLYAAGRRQIDRALELGVSEGETPVVVLVAADGGRDGSGETPDTTAAESRAAERVRGLLTPDETLGEYDEARIRAFFDVTDRELAATDGDLADVIHERVALLDVKK